MTETDSIREKVIGSAQAYAKIQGWPWLTPIEIALTRAIPADRQWTVKTNAYAVGRNVRIVIREADMSVIDAAFLPR
jgi:hypothetical protein